VREELGRIDPVRSDNEWNSLGARGGYSSVGAVKAAIERTYRGLMKEWVDTTVTETQARDFLEPEFRDEKCSFCGRWPINVKQMIGDDVRICNLCVEEF
jgi:hypothetical protein